MHTAHSTPARIHLYSSLFKAKRNDGFSLVCMNLYNTYKIFKIKYCTNFHSTVKAIRCIMDGLLEHILKRYVCIY